jgi:aspartate aminotransferase
MVKLSEVAKALPFSATRKLIPYAQQAAARGVKVYKLNIGQPDVDSPKCAIDAVKAINLKKISYPDSHGNTSLREGMVKYYKGIGINVETEDIIVTNGGSEGVSIAIAATCNPGEELLTFEPFYANYKNMCIQHGVNLRTVPTHIENGFALPDMSEIEKNITPKTRALLVINPGNPTGCLYSKESLLQLGEIAKKHDLWIISDEVYREFCFTDEPHFSCMHIPGLEQNVILIDSVSKRYNLCGVRIGFLVSHNKEFMGSVLRFAQARLCSGALGQIAAEGALATPQSYFDQTRAEFIHRRNALVEALNKIPGVTAPMPTGAFYAVAKLPVDNAEKFAIWMLEHFEHKGHTVQVTPMAGFCTTNLGDQMIRIAYVLSAEELLEAVECIKVALEQYPGTIR